MKFIEALQRLQLTPGLYFMYRTRSRLDWYGKHIDIRYVDNRLFICDNGKASSDQMPMEWVTTDDWSIDYTKDIEYKDGKDEEGYPPSLLIRRRDGTEAPTAGSILRSRDEADSKKEEDNS